MSSRLWGLPVLFLGVALCLTGNAQPSSEPFGVAGANLGGGGGLPAVGGAGGISTGGNPAAGGGPGAGGNEPSGNGGAGGGTESVAAPVSAGAGPYANASPREIDKCNCRTVKPAPAEGATLWLLVVGAALTRCRRRSR